MINSKKLLVVAGVTPKLKLGTKTNKGVVSTGPHKVKLLEDKIIKGLDPRTNKEIEFVEYVLEENGEKKVYKTKMRGADNMPSYLVQEMANYEEGDEVYMEMKKSGAKNYVSVSPVKDMVEVDDEDETINIE